MAPTKKRKSSPKHHRAGSAKRHNPARQHRRRRSNPGMGLGQAKQWFMGGAGVLVGVVGTRALPQMFLGTSNTGMIGYAANAAATALLAFAAHFFSKDKVLSASVVAGGVASIFSRIIQDYSIFGQYSSQVGLGDYLMSDFLTPQTLTDGLNSAQLGRPGYVAPAPAVNVQGAGMSLAGLGRPLY